MLGFLSGAVLLATAAVAGTWFYENVMLPVRRLHATKYIPDPTEGHWLLGHIPALLAIPMTSFRLFHAWAQQYGPIFRIRFFWRPVLVVTDPDLYQPLLRPGPSKLPKYTPPYKMFEVFVRPPRSNMLSSSETDTWKSTRRAAVAALTMNNLRLCFPHIVAVTQRLIDSLAEAGPEVKQDMDLAAQQITVDVIGMAAFDRDLQATVNRQTGAHGKAQENADSHRACRRTPAGVYSSAGGGGSGRGISGRGAEVLEVMRHLVVAMQSRNNPLNRWFPWRKAYRELMYWGGRMSDLVVDLTCDMEAHPPPPHSLGAHLLACKHIATGPMLRLPVCGAGEPLDRIQIMTELGVLWGAGFETTAHTICWTLFLISTHPEAEARVTAELDSLSLLASPHKPQPAELQWEHLAQLKYLSAALNESMRLFPAVASGTIRVTHKPTTLGGHKLPAGQPILIPFFAIHRSPKLWDEPDAYKPERWLKDEAATAPGPAAAVAAVQNDSAADSIASEDDDYVDVAADVYSPRDQNTGTNQTLQQQGGVGGKLSSRAAAAGVQAQPHAAAAGVQAQPHAAAAGVQAQPHAAAAGVQAQPHASKHGSTGLELKDPTVSRRGFLPFSEGSRNCVGQALALVELKAVLAMLIGNFTFTLAPEAGGYAGVDADARLAITLRPEHGLLMTLRHRSLPPA